MAKRKKIVWNLTPLGTYLSEFANAKNKSPNEYNLSSTTFLVKFEYFILIVITAIERNHKTSSDCNLTNQ